MMNVLGLFDGSSLPDYASAAKEIYKSRNKELKELFSAGFGIHHAGMLRSDRNMVERYFEKGYMKVKSYQTRFTASNLCKRCFAVLLL
jgi:hypothetical protein